MSDEIWLSPFPRNQTAVNVVVTHHSPAVSQKNHGNKFLGQKRLLLIEIMELDEINTPIYKKFYCAIQNKWCRMLTKGVCVFA